MKIPVGNLLDSGSSVGTTGWSVSIVAHAIGALVGVLCIGSGWIKRDELPDNTNKVTLEAGWARPKESVPSIEIAPTISPELPQVYTEAVAPIEREHPPIEVDASWTATEPTAGEPVPVPVLIAPKRDIDCYCKELAQSVASRPPVPRPQVLPQDVVSVGAQSISRASSAAVDQLPRKLQTNPRPPYPPDAFARRQQGQVLLEVHINQRGLVEDVFVSKSSGVASLDQAALETVHNWRFEPARRDGAPVSTVVTVPIRFVFRDPR